MNTATHFWCVRLLLAWALLGAAVCARAASTNALSTNGSVSARTSDPIARIREEGLNRSQVMPTLGYLTEVIGPRLTGSPQLKRANEWTRDKLAEWGLKNAEVEPWGHFGRGWSLHRFSVQVVEPQSIPLIATPKAWTPGLAQPITADVVFLDAKTEADLEKHKGKLKGAIVLASPVREVRARWEPMATRTSESNLLRLANAGSSTSRRGFQLSTPTNPAAMTNESRITGTSGRGFSRRGDGPLLSGTGTNIARSATNAPRGGTTTLSLSRLIAFLAAEEPALVLTASSQGDGGTLFVAEASTPESRQRSAGATNTRSRAIWSTNAPAVPPQVMVAMEDYNRLVRMIQQGEKLKIAAELQVQFHTNDLMAYNTVAEIPGSDLDDEVVMIGAHLDSWHGGTGATDNGAGVAATMEAVRILKALDLKPRRTIRIGLWTGEEQGLLGSRAYVSKHFGYYTNITNAAVVRSPRDESNAPRRIRSGTNATNRKLLKQRDYEKFSAYYNLDNGTGKIRGVYMQVKP